MLGLVLSSFAEHWPLCRPIIHKERQTQPATLAQSPLGLTQRHFTQSKTNSIVFNFVSFPLILLSFFRQFINSFFIDSLERKKSEMTSWLSAFVLSFRRSQWRQAALNPPKRQESQPTLPPLSALHASLFKNNQKVQ